MLLYSIVLTTLDNILLILFTHYYKNKFFEKFTRGLSETEVEFMNSIFGDFESSSNKISLHEPSDISSFQDICSML